MENEEIKVKVKVCKKCGLTFSEKTKVCEVCGNRLGDALDYETAENLSEDIAEKNEETKKKIASEKYGAPAGDPENPGIEVTTTHKVIGIISSIVIVVIVVLLIIAGVSKSVLNNDNIDGNFYSFNIGIIILMGYLGVFNSFWPNEFWMFNHMFDRLHYNENLTPTDFAISCSHIGSVMFALIGIGIIVLDIWLMFLK